jgi:hypothetical protein
MVLVFFFEFLGKAKEATYIFTRSLNKTAGLRGALK